MKYNANKYCSKIKFLYCSISNSSIENYLYSYVCSIQVEKLNQVSSFRYQSLSSEELNLGIRMSQISHFQYHILLNPNLDPVSYMMNYLKRYLNLKTSDFSCKKKKLGKLIACRLVLDFSSTPEELARQGSQFTKELNSAMGTPFDEVDFFPTDDALRGTHLLPTATFNL